MDCIHITNEPAVFYTSGKTKTRKTCRATPPRSPLRANENAARAVLEMRLCTIKDQLGKLKYLKNAVFLVIFSYF